MRARRLAIVAVAVATLGIVTVAPARADYHGVCTTAAADTLTLRAAGATLTATGSVFCGGAHVSINPLTLAPATGGEPTASATASGADQATATASVTAAPGVWEATMTFTVTVNGTTLAPSTRVAWFAWPGAGSPVRVCYSQGNNVSCPS